MKMMKKWLLRMLFALGVVVSILLVNFFDSDTTWNLDVVVFEIKQGETLNSVSKRLKEDGIIEFSTRFQMTVKRLGYESELKAGEYEVSPYMELDQLAENFAKGKVIVEETEETVSVTIPEGLTVPQIAKRLHDNAIVDEKEFLDIAYNWTGEEWFLEGIPVDKHRLDGFLFPATYQFPLGADPKMVISKMLATFSEYVTPYQKEIEGSELSVREIVTMAALIEKEARHDEDRPKIASVIYNRLEKDMKLQLDATVLFVIGHKQKVYYKDLEVDSPYNTYRYKGLTPSPIAAPGLKSIEAVLHPEKTPFIFYVANKKTGYHHFAETFSEHEQNIEKYWK